MANLAKVSTMRARLERLKERSEHAMSVGIQTVEVAGASALAGYVNVKYGTGNELAIQGVPVDLAAGLALIGGDFLKLWGRHGEHACNLGAGFLAGYGYRLGQSLATK
jgi:hypothetical protein